MFFQLFIFASVAALAVSGASLDDCPRHLHEHGLLGNLRVFGQRCYTFHPDRTREFGAAEYFCKSNGGHLVKIPDLQTQNFLYSTMRNSFNYYGRVWIGLSDTEAEGHFRWMDGSPATYTNWVPGQPDSVLGIVDSLQNCVYMDLGDRGRWRDDRCNGHLLFFHPHSRPFICEYPVTKHTTPTTTTTKKSTAQPATTMMIPSSTVATTHQPNSQQPTTAARKSTTPPPTLTSATPQPTTTTGATTTAQQGTTPGVAATTTPIPSEPSTPGSLSVSASGCPTFHCTNDCGLGGYRLDGNGCLTCDCNV